MAKEVAASPAPAAAPAASPVQESAPAGAYGPVESVEHSDFDGEKPLYDPDDIAAALSGGEQAAMKGTMCRKTTATLRKRLRLPVMTPVKLVMAWKAARKSLRPSPCPRAGKKACGRAFLMPRNRQYRPVNRPMPRPWGRRRRK